MITTDLWPEQKEAVEWLLGRKSGILADPTGSGKTLSVLASFDQLQHQDDRVRLVVLATKTALGTWENQIEDHTDFKYMTIGTETIERLKQVDFEKADIFVFSYQSFWEPRKQGIPGHEQIVYRLKQPAISAITRLYRKSQNQIVLVLEEAHFFKNPSAKRTQLTVKLAKFSKRVWGMTATPYRSMLVDLHGLVDVVCKGYLGSRGQFERKYVKKKKKRRRDGRVYYEVVGYKNLGELKERLKDVMLHRTIDYDIRFRPIKIKLTSEEERLYQIAASGILDIEDERDFSGRLPDLQRVVDNAVVEGRERNLSKDLSSKEVVLVKWLREQIEEDRAPIVFCIYRDTYARLSLVLNREFSVKIWEMDASSDSKERQQVENDFKKGEILLMTNVGAASLNLQQSNDLWLYDTPMSLGDFVQVVGRIARADSEHEYFNVYIPSVIDTIDEYRVARIIRHGDELKDVLSGKKSLPSIDDVGGKYGKSLQSLRKWMLWRRG